MAALFENLPTLGNYIQNTVAARGVGGVSTSALIIYVGLAVLILIVVVNMLRGVKIDFSWLDPRPQVLKTTMSAYLFMKPGLVFTNIVVPATESVREFKNDEYSLIFDCVLYDTRAYTNGNWRHILHRGSGDLTPTDTLPRYGLARNMNPGVYLDPNTNDIIVFVDTEGGDEFYRESLRITDVPMDVPFRLGVVVKGRVFEVYINGKLEETKVLVGTPRNVDNAWYGLAGSAAAAAQLQNLYVWNRALNATEIGSVCGAGLPTFTVKRAVCGGAGGTAATP
jgi:hypothetical protein